MSEEKEKDMSPEAVKEALKTLQEMLEIPSLRKIILPQLGLDLSRTGSGTYYNPNLAKGLIPTIDAMIADEKKRPFLLPLDFYGPYMSINSLKARLFQAAKYLVDHLDTDDRKYYTWRSNVDFSIRDNGIIIKWKSLKQAAPSNLAWHAVPVDEDEKSNEWKDALYSWMENPVDDWIHLKGLQLSVLDLKTVKDLFENVTWPNGKPMYMLTVRTDSIYVEKTKEDSNEERS
jgi:hypothetical protein